MFISKRAFFSGIGIAILVIGAFAFWAGTTIFDMRDESKKTNHDLAVAQAAGGLAVDLAKYHPEVFKEEKIFKELAWLTLGVSKPEEPLSIVEEKDKVTVRFTFTQGLPPMCSTASMDGSRQRGPC